MTPPENQQELLVAPAQMTVGALDDFRLAVIEAVTRASAETTPHLSVDLRGTQAIDATGLGVLLLFHKRAREKSLKVRLLGPSPAVLEVLKNTRVHLLFEILAPADVARLLGGGATSSAAPAPPSLDEVDPHPSVAFPGLSNPFEPSSVSLATEAASGEAEPTPEPAPEHVAPAFAPLVDDPIEELAPVVIADAVVSEAVVAAAEARCPDCGRLLPSDREVQFCPWCGAGEQVSAAPDVPPPTSRATTSPPVATSITAPVAASSVAPALRPPRSSRPTAASPATPPAAPPSHPAPLPRREAMAPHADDFRALLDATQLYHRIDEDGDARIIFPLESGRTQTAWITRNVDAIGEYAFRYVMSFVADAGEIAGNFALMSSLLEQVSAKKGGGLVTRGSMVLYRIPVSTQATPESLAGAVALAAGVADELETAITGEA